MRGAEPGLGTGLYEGHGSPGSGFGGSNDSSLRILSVCSYCPRPPTSARHAVSLPRERETPRIAQPHKFLASSAVSVSSLASGRILLTSGISGSVRGFWLSGPFGSTRCQTRFVIAIFLMLSIQSCHVDGPDRMSWPVTAFVAAISCRRLRSVLDWAFRPLWTG